MGTSTPPSLSASDVSLALSDPFGLWHDHHGDLKLKDPEDEYKIFLKEQGLRIEKELLAKRHASFVDLKDEPFEAAAKQTAELMKQGNVVIYGGALSTEKLGLYGRPDVIVVEPKRNAVIEEYKLAGVPDDRHKIQALAYAHLMTKSHGHSCEARVVSRNNEEFPVPYEEQLVESAIQRAREILSQKKPPYPVHDCPGSEWHGLQNKMAREQTDVTLAWNVGRAIAGKFHSIGVHTLQDLAKMDPQALKSIKGLGAKKIPQLTNSVKAQLSKKVIKTGKWEPIGTGAETEIFLDLEGTGELFQDDPAWNCIYLIGVIAREKGKVGPYKSFLAKVPEQEKGILAQFLEYLKAQRSEYWLLHWFHYERSQLKKACEKHGLQEEFERWIAPRLKDLRVPAQAACVLPLPSWSIKAVGPHFGFEWSQDASEVDAMKSAMIWFKQAASGGDGAGLGKVIRYNEDDCRAMIVVLDGFEKLSECT